MNRAAAWFALCLLAAACGPAPAPTPGRYPFAWAYDIDARPEDSNLLAPHRVVFSREAAVPR